MEDDVEDQNLDLPEDVTSLSLEDATGLLDKVVEAGRRVAQSADSAEKLEALRALSETKAALSAHIAELNAASEALAAEALELSAQFGADDEEVADEEEVVETPTEEVAEVVETETLSATRTVNLSSFAAAPTHRQPKQKEIASVEDLLDTSRYSSEFTALNGLKPTSGDSYATKIIDQVELFPQGFDHAFSSTASGQDNLRRFMDLQDFAANASKTAAGGFCGPGDTIKDVVQCGTSTRPIEALFQRIPVNGQFRYIRGVDLTTVLTGATSWSNTADLAVDPADTATWKPCVDMACSPDINAEVYAVVFCGSFGEFQNFSNPSLVRDFLRKGGIAYARVAEGELLRRIFQQSTQFTYDASTVITGHGAVAAVVDAIWTILGDALYAGRLDLASYTVVLPPGLLALLWIDNEIRGFKNPDDAKLDLSGKLNGLRVVEALDVRTGSVNTPVATPAAGGPAAAVHALRDTFDVYIVPTGDFALGQKSLVDVGVQRDGTLVRQNKAQYFVEGIESLEKLGCNPSFAVELSGLCANGGRAGLATPRTCG